MATLTRVRHLSIPVSACKNQSADKSYASENKKGSDTEDERTATLELLNQRGKESENVCHRRRIRIGGREGGGAGGSLAHAILAIKVPIDGCSAGKG